MYGYDTHSWRNSTENRQQKQECAEVTAKFEAGSLTFAPVDVTAWTMCHCDDRPYPHDPQYWHGTEWPKVWTRRPQ
jgi:hypothetical protein